MEIVIVIPVYKDYDDAEKKSLSRCCEVLSKYKTVLVCPKKIDINKYKNLWDKYNLELFVERFDSNFFSSIAGYNRLLLSKEFYLRFAKYDYMLIYQPDAYVFRDELIEWCNKGYDYIGAPLVGKFEEKTYHSRMPMRVGNGGFSLRKISSYLNFFSGTSKVFSSKQICKRIASQEKPYRRVLVWLLMMFGWRNKPKSVADHWKHNEDDFWSRVLNGTNYEMSKPKPREAMGFAFERFPKELYQITKTLPFGCHAWKKYEYEDFWIKHIK